MNSCHASWQCTPSLLMPIRLASSAANCSAASLKASISVGHTNVKSAG